MASGLASSRCVCQSQTASVGRAWEIGDGEKRCALALTARGSSPGTQTCFVGFVPRLLSACCVAAPCPCGRLHVEVFQQPGLGQGRGFDLSLKQRLGVKMRTGCRTTDKTDGLEEILLGSHRQTSGLWREKTLLRHWTTVDLASDVYQGSQRELTYWRHLVFSAVRKLRLPSAMYRFRPRFALRQRKTIPELETPAEDQREDPPSR